jgi:hypothetical protein
MKRQRTLSEDLKYDEPPARASERSFGMVFAALFLVVSLWPLLAGGAPRWWALALAAAFLLAGLVYPQVLRPLNSVWLGFGLLLHRIVSPLILGMLFYLTVLPTGLVMRALGKDPLRLRFDRNAPSYWIERRPPGPEPESLRNQF